MGGLLEELSPAEEPTTRKPKAGREILVPKEEAKNFCC
jgi:hypothetical protein